MPERDVDGLEVVEVDEQDGDRQALAQRAADRVRYPVLEQLAIGQVGQRVVERAPVQPLLELLALADVPDGEHDAPYGGIVAEVEEDPLDRDERAVAVRGQPVRGDRLADSGGGLCQGAHDGRAVVSADELVEPRRPPGIQAAPEHRFEHRRRVADRVPGAYDQDQVRRVPQQGLEAALALLAVEAVAARPEAPHQECHEHHSASERERRTVAHGVLPAPCLHSIAPLQRGGTLGELARGCEPSSGHAGRPWEPVGELAHASGQSGGLGVAARGAEEPRGAAAQAPACASEVARAGTGRGHRPRAHLLDVRRDVRGDAGAVERVLGRAVGAAHPRGPENGKGYDEGRDEPARPALLAPAGDPACRERTDAQEQAGPCGARLRLPRRGCCLGPQGHAHPDRVAPART